MNFEVVQRAVLLTDLVDSASHTEKVGDLAFAGLMAELEHEIRALIRQFRGREIDKTDGFLIVFEHSLDALAFALLLNDRMRAFSRARGETFQMRTGLHYGTLVLRQNPAEQVADGAKSLDADGITKIIAARITALAEPGQVLITRTLFDLIRENEATQEQLGDDAHWLAHGPYLLHGLNDPVEIFEVGYPGRSPLRPPSDKNKARRAILPQDEFVLGWRPATGQIIPSAPDWRVVKKLGEGGYGEVWLAEHIRRSARRVFKFCFDPTRIRSLNREKFLLGIIQENLGKRDDIVTIEDWNTASPPFFIALEYIPVDNMATWLDKRQHSSPLPEAMILSILRKTAVALQAAHSVGVLHKDIKPSNLLVGGDLRDPHIHLIDFGVGLYAPTGEESTPTSSSSSTSGSDRTTLRTSSLAGSRMYLAPEVAEGKLPSVQADLFSLGVLLYQLLRNDLAIGLKVGWERDVADPFLAELIAGSTDGDLDKRFKSVSEFIRQVDTIEARRSQAETAAREAAQRREYERILEKQRRRRIFYAAALAIAIPLVFVSGVFAFRSHQSSRRATLKAAEATEARAKANNLISFMLEDLTRELQRAGQLPLMDSVTSQTLSYFENESSATLSHTELYNRGKAFYNLGDVFFARNDMSQAEQSFNAAHSIAVGLNRADPANRDYRALMADVLHSQATVNDRQRKFDNVLPLYEAALRLREDLYEDKPGDLPAAFAFARSCQVYGYTNRATTGTSLVQRAIDVTSAALAQAPDSMDVQFRHATSNYYMARVAAPGERWEPLKKAIELFEDLHRRAPRNYDYTVSLLNAYQFYGRSSLCCDPDLALMYLKKGSDLCNTLMEKDYSNHEWRRLSAKCLASYAIALVGVDDYEQCYQQTALAANLLDDMILSDPTNYWIWADYWSNRRQFQESLAMQGKFDGYLTAMEHTNDTLKAVMKKDPKLTYFPQRYLENSASIALFNADPSRAATALKEVKEHLQAGTAEQREDTELALRSLEALLQAETAFDVHPLEWEAKTELEGTDQRANLTVANDTTEAFIVQVFAPDSDTPFINQMLSASRNGTFSTTNLTHFCRGYYGISVNGCPITTVASVAENIGSGYFRINMSQLLNSHGDQMKYRVKVQF